MRPLRAPRHPIAAPHSASACEPRCESWCDSRRFSALHLPSAPSQARALVGLLLASLLLLSGCLSDAGDTSYAYDNPLDTVDDTGSSDTIAELEIAYLDEVNEVVFILNTGTTEIDLAGYVLQELNETDTTNWYTFPDATTLAVSRFIRVHTGDGDDTTTDLYWSGGETWASGKTAAIINAEGTILDTCDDGDLCWGQ